MRPSLSAVSLRECCAPTDPSRATSLRDAPQQRAGGGCRGMAFSLVLLNGLDSDTDPLADGHSLRLQLVTTPLLVTQ